MEETRQIEPLKRGENLKSFLNEIVDEEDFKVFVAELRAVDKAMQNRAGMFIFRMLEIRLFHAQSSHPVSGGPIKPESLPEMNYMNGHADGREQEIMNMLSPCFGLAKIVEDNEPELRAKWRKSKQDGGE